MDYLPAPSTTWSPCGQFIATQTKAVVEIRDPHTFQLLSILQPIESTSQLRGTPVYSPDGYSIATPSDDAMWVWDIQTGDVVKKIQWDKVNNVSLVWSLDGGEICTVAQSQITGIWTVCLYSVTSGIATPPLRFFSQSEPYPWVHNKSFRVMTTVECDKGHTIDIIEVGHALTRVESFCIQLGEHNFLVKSFSPVTHRISILTHRNRGHLLILDIQNSEALLDEEGCFNSHCFSSDGSLFVASQSAGGIHIWRCDNKHYILWRQFQSSASPSSCFLFSPTLSSLLGHFWYTLRLWQLDDCSITPPINNQLLSAVSHSGAHVATVPSGGSTITITNLLSQALHHFIDTDIEIQELGLCNNVLLAVGSKAAMAWLLGEEGLVKGLPSDQRAGPSNCIWAVSLLGGSTPLQYLAWGQTGIVKSKGSILHTEPGEVFKPSQAPLYFSNLWSNITDMASDQYHPQVTWKDCVQGAKYQCLDGTRVALLEEIETWAEDLTQLPILWLNGIAGTGKSTVAQALVEWGHTHGKSVASFFCSQHTRSYRNLHFIFPTLAIQLAEMYPIVQSTLAPLLQYNPDIIYELPSSQMEKLIVEPLKLVDSLTLIVIDALDEWEDDTSQSVLLSSMEFWVKDLPKVKFLVTSRPKPHILAGFHLLLLEGLAGELLLHDTPIHTINSDIWLFLKHELFRLASQHGLYDWPTDAQLDLLCSRAAGIFVCAVATVKFLDHEHTPPNIQYTVIADSKGDTTHEGMLEGVHGGLSLDSLCTSILQTAFKYNNTEDDAIMCSVLATIALVTCPLSPSAIATLTCLGVVEVMSILRAIQPLLRLHGDPSQPVFPFHRMFLDLLTNATRCVDKRFYISPAKFHSEITLHCLQLMNGSLKDGFSLQNTPTNSETDCSPEEVALRYASTSWHIHLAETRGDVTTLVPILHNFLEEKLTVWLGLISVMGARVAPVAILKETISWAQKVCLEFTLTCPPPLTNSKLGSKR